MLYKKANANSCAKWDLFKKAMFWMWQEATQKLDISYLVQMVFSKNLNFRSCCYRCHGRSQSVLKEKNSTGWCVWSEPWFCWLWFWEFRYVAQWGAVPSMPDLQLPKSTKLGSDQMRHPVLCPHQLIERNVVQKSAVPPTTLMRRYTLRLLWNEEL